MERSGDEWDRREACHITKCIELPVSARCVQVPVRSLIVYRVFHNVLHD
jgi:hypothetical protein